MQKRTNLYGFYNQRKSSRLKVERHRLVGLVYGGISAQENFALFNYIAIFHLFSLSAIALDIEGGSGFREEIASPLFQSGEAILLFFNGLMYSCFRKRPKYRLLGTCNRLFSGEHRDNLWDKEFLFSEYS